MHRTLRVLCSHIYSYNINATTTHTHMSLLQQVIRRLAWNYRVSIAILRLAAHNSHHSTPMHSSQHCTPDTHQCTSLTPMHPIFKVRKGDPITSYLCSGGLIRGAYHNILKFNYNLYSSSLDVYQKRCVLYKLLISLRCMNESPTPTACVSTGSRRCVYKSFSLSRFKLLVFTLSCSGPSV